MSLTKVASSMLAGGSTGGGGSVGKNYISQYNNGTCNGDFESGNSIGWNLCTVSSISNGLPSGITVGAGSVATSVISTGQIAGQFSLQTIYPNVANQGIITDVFTIDTEDQAKVMTFKFYYNVTSGASNSNFSGTSSNTFIVGIYAVNGSNIGWIQPAGVYSMTQSSGGAGIATGTFQTYSDATQYRFAILCANAPSASVTMVIDDVYLGPQTAPIGAVVTDWVSYTPTLIGVNGVAYTNQTTTGQWRRVGDSIELLINSSFTGTPASGTSYFRWTLPTGLSADTTKVSSVSGAVGVARAFQAAYYTGTVFYESATTIAIAGDTGTGNFWGASSPAAFANTHTLSFTARIPVVGFSSNVQLSNDTDTRVVAAAYSRSTTQTITAATDTTVIYDTRRIDTHAAMNTGNGRYSAPVSGVYRISASVFYTSFTPAAGNPMQMRFIKRNAAGSILEDIYKDNFTANAAVGQEVALRSSSLFYCNAGETLEVILWQNTAASRTTIALINLVDIERLSGPSVIAASESVNANYFTTSTGAMAVGTPAVVVFGTRSFDSHNAYNSTTGIYTVPVSGKYQVNATITSASTSQIQSLVLDIMKNGTTWNRFTPSRLAAVGSALSAINSAIVAVNAGDTIEIRCSMTSGTGNFDGNAFGNNFTIARVGN